MIHDPAVNRLGRQAPRDDARTLKLTDYLVELPDVPPMKNWGEHVASWGLMGNDRLGDCTAAAAGHLILLATMARGAGIWLPDEDIIAAYSAVGGYVAGDPSTDRGARELDLLSYWRKTGIGGHKILAFLSVPTFNTKLIRQAIYLFGGVYAGVDLPINAQDQNIWRVVEMETDDSAPGGWGGHAIPLIGYDTFSLACATWGQQKWMTESWWRTYGSEAWVVLTEDWAPPAGLSPSAFNRDQLLADVAAISKGT